MKRTGLLAVVTVAAIGLWLAPSSASALFSQCPPIIRDQGCQYLVVVSDGGATVVEDPTQPPYDPGGEDTLLAVQNDSSRPISSIALFAGNAFFGFDNDGICHNVGRPWAPGCVVLAQDSAHQPTAHPGASCPPEENTCGFPPPPGEPPGVKFSAGISIIGYGANGDPVTGYEGPTSWFSDISPDAHEGNVNFSPPIAPGGSAYFALESPPLGQIPAVLAPTSVSTVQSGGGSTGASITVPQGTPVSDSASISGAKVAGATGTVAYGLYSDGSCTKALAASTGAVSAGHAAPSAPVTPAPGKYFWRASYSGDTANGPSSSDCGDEVLQVARSANLNLPSSRICLSRRRFIAHPRAPRHVSLRSVTILINGRMKFTGRLVGTHTTIDLRGLPAGTFHVAMIARSSTGRVYEDLRTFHTCVARHHGQAPRRKR
jgi:hypothetical protein